MVYQWEHLTWWLSQNSAAVQALMAIVGALSTIVLVTITAIYVRLTRKLSVFAKMQLETTVHPNITFSQSMSVSKPPTMVVNIQNDGAHPVHLLRVAVCIELKSKPYIREIKRLANVVIPAGGKVGAAHALEDGSYEEGDLREHFNRVVYARCTDMAGIKSHAFLWDVISGLIRHYDHPLSEKEILDHARE